MYIFYLTFLPLFFKAIEPQWTDQRGSDLHYKLIINNPIDYL